MTADITISIVSHGQIDLVSSLLQDLTVHCKKIRLEVFLTLNVSEELPASLEQPSYSLTVLHNKISMGFGENHNQAFQYATAPYFCVINPDIRIASDIFSELMEGLENQSVGVIAPLIVNADGVIEDSARKFPTPFSILYKVFGASKERDYPVGGIPLEPDWVGGMFMVFRRNTYASIGGFDQKFFLYYEDVDLCARIRLAGLRVVMTPRVRATHLARRSSHRNVAYFLMHLRSMLRFFMSMVFVKVMWRRAR